MNDKSNKKNFIILLMLLIIIGLIFGSKAFDYLQSEKQRGTAINQAGYLGEQNDRLISEESSDSGSCFTIAGYGKIELKEGDTAAKINLINPEENEGLFFLQFEIILSETGELLYTTDLLEPGTEIKDINFAHGFDKGDYEAVIKVTPVMIDDPEVKCNNMTYGITLHVE